MTTEETPKRAHVLLLTKTDGVFIRMLQHSGRVWLQYRMPGKKHWIPAFDCSEKSFHVDKLCGYMYTILKQYFTLPYTK